MNRDALSRGPRCRPRGHETRWIVHHTTHRAAVHPGLTRVINWPVRDWSAISKTGQSSKSQQKLVNEHVVGN